MTDDRFVVDHRPWQEIALPVHVPIRIFWKNELKAMVAREPHGRTDRLLWHLSISHPDRYPSWDEIVDARYQLVPDGVTMAQILPPRRQYLNIHPNCFHLWEIEP